jgi:hypothetical protein
MGVSYCVYLRDTTNINKQHNEALDASSQIVADLPESVIDGNMNQFFGEDARESAESSDGD